VEDHEFFDAALGAFFALPAEGGESPQESVRRSHAGCGFVNTVQEYRRAAEAGDRAAQEMLGLMYLYGSRLYGNGIKRDTAEAERWLERAAAQGSVLARQLLRRYVQGETNRGLHQALQAAANTDAPPRQAPFLAFPLPDSVAP